MVVWAGITMALSRPLGLRPSSIWNCVRRLRVSENNRFHRQILCLGAHLCVYPHSSSSHSSVDGEGTLPRGADTLHDNTQDSPPILFGLTDQTVIQVNVPDRKRSERRIDKNICEIAVILFIKNSRVLLFWILGCRYQFWSQVISNLNLRQFCLLFCQDWEPLKNMLIEVIWCERKNCISVLLLISRGSKSLPSKYSLLGVAGTQMFCERMQS